MYRWLCSTICGRWMEDWPTQGNPTDEALASSRSTINICSSIQHLFYGEVSTCIPCLFVPHKSCLKCVQTIFTATPMWEVDFKTCLFWAKQHFDAVSHILWYFHLVKTFSCWIFHKYELRAALPPVVTILTVPFLWQYCICNDLTFVSTETLVMLKLKHISSCLHVSIWKYCVNENVKKVSRQQHKCLYVVGAGCI